MAENKVVKATEQIHISEIGDWPEGGAKAGKATAYIPELRCEKCRILMAVWNEGEGLYYAHGQYKNCPNAGKKFKVATVELEELK